MTIGLAEIGLICLVSFATVGVSFAAGTLLRKGRTDAGSPKDPSLAIRFVRGRVADIHPDLRDILDHRDWDNSAGSLRAFFAFRFQGLPPGFPDECGEVSEFSTRSAEDATILSVRRDGDMLFIHLDRAGRNGVADHVTRYRRYTQMLARWVSKSAHNPIWVTDAAGEVYWANAAYRDLAQTIGCDGDLQDAIPKGSDPTRGLTDREHRRFRVKRGDGKADHWIDVSEEVRDDLRLHQAVDVTAVVQAEAAQHTFVQTLTKTFAQLSIGLAIFDRSRQLALFNPALVDLTGLSPEFLSARPGYLSFFDKLREGKIMPEPRSYSVWREKIFDLIAAAENGRYQETWSLSKGRTYRVTGRPHPNGAVAFIVEDISGEVTLTRRFREQLDLSHSVIESLEEAVAVFSPQGVLSYTNSAYRALWNLPSDKSALDLSVSEVSKHWQDRCEASPVWGDFRDFVVRFDERAEWDATVALKDGRRLDCRFRPLNGGATLVTFRSEGAMQAVELQGTG